MTGGAAVALIIAYLAIEGILRQGTEARSLAGSPFDRGTARASGIVFLFSGLAAPLTASLVTSVPVAVGVAGVVVMLVGLGLRVWPAITLGRFYTRSLRIIDQHQVVDTGPYRLIRHPGYLGVMALWTGYGIAWRGVLSILLAALPVILLYAYRIVIEERMLVDALPAYEGYRRRTWRLLPGIW